MWFSLDSFVLTLAQGACVALPRAGLPAGLARFRTGAWALTLPLSIAAVVAAISLASPAADVLTWVALLLVPPGAALAFGWAMRGARPCLAVLAAPLLILAWALPDDRLGQAAAATLVVGSAVTLGRLLAGAAPLALLKVGVVAMAAVDAALVFSHNLQAPNSVLVAASPGLGLPRLQSASFGSAGLGYGDFFAAAVVGGIFAAERANQLAAAVAMVAVTLCWQQLHLVTDSLPRTVPPALVLIGFEAHRRRVRRRARLGSANRAGREAEVATGRSTP